MLRAPFPWFGGKSRVARVVWEHFGDVPNFVEPFAGSLAVLLGRPTAPRVETVNDVDCYLSCFWRAVQADPEAVALHADWPINEADLHARHRWLVDQTAFRERMKTDPDYFDAKIAGWWVWGISQWIGSGWCSRVVLAAGVASKMVKADRGTASRLAVRREVLVHWFGALQERLRTVRVCCGDWKRILGPSPTIHIGVTGVFLDPPYEPAIIAEGGRGDSFAPTDKLYTQHDTGLSGEVRAWALEHGDDPRLRIALCGYEGEHDMPSSWTVYAWESQGGYSNRGTNPRRNCARERIWFNQGCQASSIRGPLFP